MLMLLQAGTPPPLPWWVMYAVLVGLTYGTWRLTRVRWWGGCLTALAGWVMILVAGMLTIPGEMGLVLAFPFIPALAWLVAMLRGRGGGSPGMAGLRARLPGPAIAQLPPGAMQGQPNPRSILRAKVMEARHAAGLPRSAAFIARMRYVSGIGEMAARPVDLFVGDAQLWVAPLTGELAAIPIPVKNVLRIDVWPELESPPTLRVNWSPPAGDGTRDLVLATPPNVPGEMIEPQLQAVAGVLQGLLRAETEAARLAADTPLTAEPAPALRACPRCGETVPPGARACPRCALPM